MRHAARKDDNKDAIVQTLLKMGASVYDLRRPVDLLVHHKGRNYLVEIKDGNKAPSAQKLTKAQVKFISEWPGNVEIIKSVDDAIAFIGRSGLEAGI